MVREAGAAEAGVPYTPRVEGWLLTLELHWETAASPQHVLASKDQGDPPQSPLRCLTARPHTRGSFLVPVRPKQKVPVAPARWDSPSNTVRSPKCLRKSMYARCPFGPNLYQCNKDPNVLAASRCIRLSPWTSFIPCASVILNAHTYYLDARKTEDAKNSSF